MRAWLQRHPLPMAATLGHTLVLTYALPADHLTPLLSPGLELDVFEGWGFLALALVDAHRLRPAGLPAACGVDLYLSGYRLFTRFRTPEGRSLRGLQILRSDTDSPWVVRLGNRLTRYRYVPCRAEARRELDRLQVEVRAPGGDLSVDVDLGSEPTEPPPGSPFPSLVDARRFAGPLPHTFSYDQEARAMVVVQGRRTGWDPRPVRVQSVRSEFLETAIPGPTPPRLANAFLLENVPYRWDRGRLVALPPGIRP